ncbi:hypothetical protein ACJX0J_007015, partial [Zea mays]
MKKAEFACLSPNELNSKAIANDRLGSITREEEVHLFQRAKVKHLLEGNDNTKFFHLLFGKPDITLIELDETNIHDIPQYDQNEKLDGAMLEFFFRKRKISSKHAWNIKLLLTLFEQIGLFAYFMISKM